MNFPIDLSEFKPLKFKISQTEPEPEQTDQLVRNIQVVRDSIVFFTAYANAKGLGGHTGGAYDIVPELLIIDGFIKGNNTVYPVYFDEAGHRVAIQYQMAVLNGYKPPESLLHYREYGSGLYGHPERDDDQGVFFSSGRLGHLWPFVNGVAKALTAIEEHKLGNVRLHFGDASELIDWLPQGGLARIDLLYPDPWPKRRHWKRRFIQDESLARLARILKRGGELRFATDIADYAVYALARVLRSKDFEWTAERADDWRKPWADFGGTRYETKAKREGRMPGYFVFRKI